MARNRIDTRSTRRRQAVNSDGETVILKPRRAKGGGKGMFSVQWITPYQVAVDHDVRKLLHEVRVALAKHFQRSLLTGRRPDGRGSLPDLSEATLNRDPGRPNKFGVLSGEMAKRWTLETTTGGTSRARAKIRPYDGGGRAIALKRWADRGIEIQSTDGEASRVIDEVIAEWLPRAVPTSGDGVATPPRAETSAGELPRFK